MMSRSNSKKKRPSVFNIVDVLIALVIIVALAYVLYVSVLGHSLSDIGAIKLNVEYTIAFDCSNECDIKVGNSVFSHDGKTVLGRINKITQSTNDDGSYSYELNVVTQAFFKKSLYIDKTEIEPGKEMAVRFPHYSPSNGVKCTEVKVIY